MASIIPPIPWPAQSYLATQSSVPAFSAAHTLDATTDQFELHFRAVEAATITEVVLRVNAITGTPGTCRIGIQGSSATTGAASGTWLGSTNTGYADVTSYGTAGTCLTVTLGESVTVARGDCFVIVADPQATGTWDASNSIAITYSAVGGIQERVPYAVLNGTKTATVVGIGGYRTGSRSYGDIVETISNVLPTSSSTPDEIALKWTLPALCDTYQVVGARITANYTAGRTFTMRLYDSDGGTVLQSVDIDTDQGIAGQGTHDWFFDESTLSTLSAGTAYRLSYLPGASSAGTFSTWTTPTSGDMDAMTGGGAMYSTRTDAGAWTDTNTQMPCIQVLISDMTVTGGGSGGGAQIFAAGVVR